MTAKKISIVICVLSFIGSSALAVPLVASVCGLLPRTKSTAWSSSDFYNANLSPSSAREINLVNEVMAGNIPDRLRQFLPIRLSGKVKGLSVALELSVAPDYLMIGTDADFVRTPMTNYAAQFLASEMGMALPTAYLVDEIYRQADVKLVPQPTDWYKRDALMRLGTNYIIFNKTIETQRASRVGLVAGHKKDVVLTNRLDQAPARVAIYGWQEPGGAPIQPLGTPHDYTYEDYSHGIRLLGPWVKVTSVATGQVSMWPTPAALADADLGNILNGGQGALHDVRAGRTCTPEFRKAFGLIAGDCPRQPRVCTP